MKNLATTVFVGIFSCLALFGGTFLIDEPVVKEEKTSITKIVESNDVLVQLLNSSIMITNDRGHGSGTLVTRKLKVNGVEKEYNFVITCGHVVEGLVNNGVMDDSSLFGHQPQIYNHKMIGTSKFKLKVLKYDGQLGEDIGVLLVESTLIDRKGAKFYLGKPVTPLGSEVWHVGSPESIEFPNTLLYGHVSGIGRIILGEVYDSIQAGASPGSSGGGVFNKDGIYVGMLARTLNESNNFIVPIRRIKSYLEKEKMLWLIDPSVKTPENLEDVL